MGPDDKARSIALLEDGSTFSESKPINVTTLDKYAYIKTGRYGCTILNI